MAKKQRIKVKNYGVRDSKETQVPHKMTFFTLSVKDILGKQINTKCNPHAILSGFTASGSPICECRGLYQPPTDLTKFNHKGPICELIPAGQNPWLCEDNAVFRGFSDNGVADCRSVEQHDCGTFPGVTTCLITIGFVFIISLVGT